MKIGFQAYIPKSAEAIEFYQKAFGATLGYNVRNDDGTYMHAELYLDGELLMALSEGSGVGLEDLKKYTPKDYPAMNFCVKLNDEEAAKKAYDVLSEGGNVLLPLGPLPWSACCANVVDRFGVFWYIYV